VSAKKAEVRFTLEKSVFQQFLASRGSLLNPARLPFRHSGMSRKITGLKHVLQCHPCAGFLPSGHQRVNQFGIAVRRTLATSSQAGFVIRP
jgi:hypothetical protein